MLSPRILLGKCTMFSFLIRRLRGPEPIWHIFLAILIFPTLEKKKKNTLQQCGGGGACGAHAHVIYVKVRGQIGIVGAPLLLCGAQTSSTYIFLPSLLGPWKTSSLASGSMSYFPVFSLFC